MHFIWKTNNKAKEWEWHTGDLHQIHQISLSSLDMNLFDFNSCSYRLNISYPHPEYRHHPTDNRSFHRRWRDEEFSRSLLCEVLQSEILGPLEQFRISSVCPIATDRVESDPTCRDRSSTWHENQNRYFLKKFGMNYKMFRDILQLVLKLLKISWILLT